MVNNLATSPSFIANSTACRHLAITPLLVQSQTRNPPTCFQFHRGRFHGIDRLGMWLRANLFEHHVKSYSKSRRKAPILWQLGTPSGRYSVWLYAHRLTRDSFFQIQNDVVTPKLTHEERQLTSLIQNAVGSPS